MIKRFVILSLIGCALSSRALETLSSDKVNQISSAIYKIEGGNKTKYPYGVRSIDTKGDISKAKLICENTIRNNYIRWQKSGKTNDFLTFLSQKYAPTSGSITISEKKCNKYWLPNIISILGTNTNERLFK